MATCAIRVGSRPAVCWFVGSDRALPADVASVRRSSAICAERIARRVRAQGHVACVRLKTSGFPMLARQRRLAKPEHLSREFFHAAK